MEVDVLEVLDDEEAVAAVAAVLVDELEEDDDETDPLTDRTSDLIYPFFPE